MEIFHRMGAMLQDFREKIKGQIFNLINDDKFFLASLLIVTSLLSFGLGRRSVDDNLLSKDQYTEEVSWDIKNSDTGSLVDKGTVDSSRYVASKNSSVYHLAHCSGAKRISEENKIYFNSKEEAEAAGLRPAANCPGI